MVLASASPAAWKTYVDFNLLDSTDYSAVDTDWYWCLSTAEERESQLKRSRPGSISKGSRPKRNSQNLCLSPHHTSDAADPTSIGEPLDIQPGRSQDSRATLARSAKARSIRHSAPKTARSKAKTLAKVVRDEKPRVTRREGRVKNPAIILLRDLRHGEMGGRESHLAGSNSKLAYVSCKSFRKVAIWDCV
jgi:hypothetical protein